MAFFYVHYVFIYQTVTSLTYVFVLLDFRPRPVPLQEQKTQLEIVYYAKKDGMTINLRNFSRSEDDTKARWTVEVIKNEQLNNLQGKVKKPIEIKFR